MRSRILAFVVLVALGVAADARASTVVRADRDAVLRAGPFTGDPYGRVAAGVGDVNGDGLGDVAVLQEPPGSPGFVPTLAVVLGRRDRASLDPAVLGPAGFVATDAPDQVPTDSRGGGRSGDEVATSVTGAGDVNGDGLADIAVGMAIVGNSLRRESGSVFVVFGSREPAPVRLDELGDRGFRIDGPRAQASIGSTVAGLGDVNGDGLADLGVGGIGAAFVVFGARSSGLVDLRRPPGRAYALISADREDPDFNTHAVAAAGDADGDGRGDVAVAVDAGAPYYQRVAVVFGKADTAPVDLRRPGPRFYDVVGYGQGGPDAGAFGPAGDVDADGRGDLVLAGERGAWVVPGRAGGALVDVREARDVLTIRTRQQDATVAGTGDLNGDGRADVAIAEPDVVGACGDGGAISVVHGRRGGDLDTRRLDAAAGFRVFGAPGTSGIGEAIAFPGDVDGDGRADLATLDARPREERLDAPPRLADLQVVRAGPTAEPLPTQGAACTRIRSLTPSLRSALRRRGVRVRISERDLAPGVDLRAERLICDARGCRLLALPGFKRPLGVVGGRRPFVVKIPLGPASRRALRAPGVRALTVCVADETCVDVD